MRIVLSLSFSLLLLVGGCAESEEPIEAYSIPKTQDVYRQNHVVRQKTAKTMPPYQKSQATVTGAKSKTIVAMVLLRSASWFFAVKAPAADLKGVPEKFDQFIQSLTFENDRPNWKAVPQGWKQLAADDPKNQGIRKATILVGEEDDSPEIAVTTFRMAPGSSETNWVLINVNRWRGEVGLVPKAIDNLYTSGPESDTFNLVRKIVVNNQTVVLVRCRGVRKAKSGRPPFFRQ